MFKSQKFELQDLRHGFVHLEKFSSNFWIGPIYTRGESNE